MKALSSYQLEVLRFMADGRPAWNDRLTAHCIGDSTTLRSLHRRGLVDALDVDRACYVINAQGLRARFPVVV